MSGPDVIDLMNNVFIAELDDINILYGHFTEMYYIFLSSFIKVQDIKKDKDTTKILTILEP